ncbi:MAG: hypothetical protein JSS59_01205 [Proteobacteria bacterium]|nr:hypothetical protein [Pseudomonadota bacterium]
MCKYLFSLSVLLLAAATPAWAADHAVTVAPGGALTFSPSSLTINQGDTVTFTYAGGDMPHNAVSDTSGVFSSGNAIRSAWRYTTPPFNTAGTFGYSCTPHKSVGMTGSIVVQGDSSTTTFSIVPGITGSWYLPAQSGHGFNVEVLPNNGMLAFWYVYDNAGNNLWLVGQGTYSGDTATLTMQSGSGGLFPPNFDKNKIVRTNWGTLTLKFSDCNTASAQWSPIMPGYTSGSMDLVRLSGVSGLACP